MAGTLSWESFARGGQHILRVSNAIGDRWQFRGTWDEYCGGYLVKRMEEPIAGSLILADAAADVNDADDASDAGEADCLQIATSAQVEQDDGCVAIDQLDDFYIKELHIVYSMAHNVPVLFLKVWKRDGSCLPVDYLWKGFTTILRADDDALNRLRTLTQQEHPFLGEPWYFLHPCHTADLMANIGFSAATPAEEYMASWMSTLLPLFSCHVANEYAFDAAFKASSSGT